MKLAKPCLVAMLFFALAGQACANDSLTLAHVHKHLSLLFTHFDTTSNYCADKVISTAASDLSGIKDPSFIVKNSFLFHYTSALCYLDSLMLINKKNVAADRYHLRAQAEIMTRANNQIDQCTSEQDWMTIAGNAYYTYAGLSYEAYKKVREGLQQGKTKTKLEQAFNRDIFPDFKRLVLTSRNADVFDFDSLSYFMNLYGFNRVNQLIGMETWDQKAPIVHAKMNTNCLLNPYLNIVTQYMQLLAIAHGQARTLQSSGLSRLAINLSKDLSRMIEADKSKSPDGIHEDALWHNGLTVADCDTLSKVLQQKYPVCINMEVSMLNKKTGEPLQYGNVTLTNINTGKPIYMRTDAEGKVGFEAETDTRYRIDAGCKGYLPIPPVSISTTGRSCGEVVTQKLEMEMLIMAEGESGQ